MRLLDTTFLIDLLRGEQDALAKAKLIEKFRLFTTELNFFEIVVGIYSQKKGDYGAHLLKAEKLFSRLEILPFGHRSAIKAGQIAGELIRKGVQIDSHDCIMAGIALSNNCNIIVTRNKEHFERIKNIKVDCY